MSQSLLDKEYGLFTRHNPTLALIMLRLWSTHFSIPFTKMSQRVYLSILGFTPTFSYRQWSCIIDYNPQHKKMIVSSQDISKFDMMLNKIIIWESHIALMLIPGLHTHTQPKTIALVNDNLV